MSEPAPRLPDRLLVVEDDGIIGRHLQTLLTHQGFKVVAVVASGEQALELAAREPLDLVLMDISLGGELDGIETAGRLRQRHGLPVVYLTAYADGALLERAAATDSFGYVMKPFEDRSLHATLLTALHKHRLERRLAESEERYHAVMEQVSEGILLLDPITGRIREANLAFQRLVGYSADELSQLAPEDLAAGRAAVAGYGSPDPFATGERCYRRRDGSEVPVDVSASQIAYGDKQIRCVVVRDATARQAAEAALTRERDLLHALMDNLPDTVYYKDAESRFIRVNQAQARMLGLADPEDAIGRTDADFFSPDLAQSAWSEERDLVQTGRPIVDRIEYNPTPTGQPRWLSATKVPLRDASGRIVGLVGVSRDVTERRQRERELQAIAAVGSALRSTLTRQEMLPIVLNQIVDLLGAEGAALDGRDPLNGETITELAVGRWVGWQGRSTALGQGISGRVIATGQPYATNAVARDPLFAWPGELAGGLAAVACVPLLLLDDLGPDHREATSLGGQAQNQVIGLLWVGRVDPLSSADVRLLTAIADITAGALHRANLHEETQRRAEQLATVNALGQALTETFDLAEIYERLASTLGTLLREVTGVTIWFYDADRGALVCGYAARDGVGVDPADWPPELLVLDVTDPRREALRTHRPVIIDTGSASDAGVGEHDRDGPAATLVAPMLAKGQVIGLLQVHSHAPWLFRPHDAELLAVVANTASSAIENARLFAETERRLQYVQALHGIDQAISASLDLRVTLNVVLDQVMTQLHVDAAAVLLYNVPLQVLEFSAGRGFRSRLVEHARLRLGEGPTGRAALDRQSVMVSSLPAADETASWSELLAAEDVRAYYAVPLVAKGEVQGVLDVFQRGVLAPDYEWLDFLQTLAGEAAIAIDNAALFISLQHSNLELALAYDATIEGWSRALDMRDRETEGHTQRVTELTEQLARRMGLSPAELVQVRRGSLLHDMGKMAIPDHILLKPGPLSDDEWIIMRQHPEFAYELLMPIKYLRPALDIPLCHHEKWDGSGYPRGLHGDEIPLPARLFAVVDVWDALRSDRPYRRAWPVERVRAYIREQAGRHFDPHVVQCFEELDL